MVSKIKSSVISLTVLLGSFFWLLDGTLDYFFFYEESFVGILFTSIPPHELYIRSFWFTGLLIVGVLSSRIIKTRDIALKEKQELEELLRSVRNVNQLLVKENDKDELLRGACYDLCETRGFHHVWIALLDEDGKLISGSESGLGEKFEPMLELLETGTPPKKVKQALKKPEVIAISKAPESCEDCPLAEECNQGKTITRRLEYENQVYGLISACVPEYFVKGEELSLFEEVAGDIAFGLQDIEIKERRKETRAKLKASRKKLQEIFDNANDAIYLHKYNEERTPGQFVEVNDVATDMLGYSREEFLSMSPQDIDGGHLAERVPDIMEELVSKGQNTFEMYHETKAGSLIPVEVNSHVFELSGEKMILSIARDITERKELQRKQELFSSSLDQASLEVYWIAPDGNFSYVNENVKDKLGYTKEELSNMSVWDVDPSYGKEKRESHWAQLKKEGTLTFQSVHKKKDGETYPVEINSQYVKYQDNEYEFAFAKDITEKKKSREQLKKSEKNLRQSFIQLAETTSRVLGVRDPYTQQHEQRVAELAREVGRRMGSSEEKLLGLYLGGILHDIGKIVVPETILSKPGDLKDVEWQMIKSHPEVGYNQILKDTDFPWPVAEMTLHHHERLDGSGYPDGLEGEELTTEVRILGACDVVEAMSTRRPYREARSKERTLNVLDEGKGEKFDPEVVDILIKMIEEGEVQFE